MQRSGFFKDDGYVQQERVLIQDYSDVAAPGMFIVGSTGSIVNSTDYFVEGSGAAKITTPSGGAKELQYTPQDGGNIVISFKDSVFVCRVYIPDWTLFSPSQGISFYISNDTSQANFYYYAYTPTYNGWHYIKIHLDECAKTGSPIEENGIARYKVRFTADTAKVAVGYIDAFYTGGRERTKCLITFDDADASQHAASQIMDAAGFDGTFYITESKIDTTGLTTAQLTSMKTNGHSIAVHGLTSYATLATYEAIHADIELNKAKAALFDLDGSYHLSYPSGDNETTPGDPSIIFSALSASGIKTARTTDRKQENVRTYGGIESPWELEIGGWDADSLSDVKVALDLAIKKGVSICFMFNKIEGVTSGTTTSIADFVLFINHLIALENKGLIDVMNIVDFYNGITSPERSA